MPVGRRLRAAAPADPARRHQLVAGEGGGGRAQALADSFPGGLCAPKPPEAGLGIDVATPEATQLLTGLARDTLRNTKVRALEPFLSPRPATAP